VRKLDGVFCVNESTTTGTLRALRKAKLAGQVKLVGFDSSEPLLEGIQTQEIHGLIVQNPMQMGYLGVQSALAAIQNKPVETTVYVDAVLVTPDNYRTPEIQALIRPDS
jgi:ribose transport system substrate-binding protein